MTTNTNAAPDLKTVINFLMGDGPLNGFQFGETPEGAGKYWWRAELRRAALSTAAQPPAPAPAAQGDALPREEFAWMVVQEACETEPADEDDPECIRILRRDLKSAVLAAFFRREAASAAPRC